MHSSVAVGSGCCAGGGGTGVDVGRSGSGVSVGADSLSLTSPLNAWPYLVRQLYSVRL